MTFELIVFGEIFGRFLPVSSRIVDLSCHLVVVIQMKLSILIGRITGNSIKDVASWPPLLLALSLIII